MLEKPNFETEKACVLYRVIYVSSARRMLDAPGIEAVLAHSRAKNSVAGITGLLLYHDGGFFQILEGQRGKVEGLLSTIRADARHKDVILLWQGEAEARLFGSWSMGFVPPTDWPYPVGEGVDLRGLMRDAAPWSRDRVTGPLIRRFLGSYRDLSG